MSDKPRWTSSQNAAIEADPCTILVSAAAGSGKTSVLTERLAKKIADPLDPLTVENAVVVTFTKAAAGELKERISAKLSEQLSEKPDKRLFSQLTALPSARISTVHSFCYSLIKEHAHLLGISPNVRIADDFQSDALKSEAVRTVIRGYFEDEPGFSEHDKGDFLLLCQIVGVKVGDKNLAEFITDLHSYLNSYPEPLDLIARSLEKIREDLRAFDEGEIPLCGIGIVKNYIEHCKKLLPDAVEKLSVCKEICLGEKELTRMCLPQIERELFYAQTLFNCADENIFTAAGQKEFERFRTKGYSDPETSQRLASLRTSAKSAVETFCTKIGIDPALIVRRLRTTAALEAVCSALISDFDREYRRLKEQSNLIDYADLEQLTLKLLCENVRFDGKNALFDPTDAARRISKTVCELYVDEYQDTNTVQDMIFRAVSHEGKMFIVGDPKQSIYAFRGAVPEIFTGYKNSLSEDGADGKRKIMLSENFRCDSSVIELTNAIFSLAMNSDPDNRLYMPEDMLIKAKTQESRLKAEFILIDSSADVSDDGGDEDRDGGDGDGEDKPTLGGNAQGRYAAKRIIELVNSRIPTDSGEPIGFGDIAILARTKAKLAPVKRELRAAGIPCGADADDGFFKSAEILFITSLLKLTDDPEDDASLAAVLNSPIFGFTPDLLLEIRRAAPDGSFCAAARAFSLNGTEAAAKLKEVYALTDSLREFSRTSGVCELVKKSLEMTDALNVYSAAGGHLNRERNVKFLLDKASECDVRRDADLRMLLDDLENLKIKEDGSQSSAGCVKFLTFHGAKGLEFPVVFAVGLERGYRFSEDSNPWCADPEYGVAFKVFDETGIYKDRSELFDLIREKHQKQIKEEETRLLYVAMTRARQKLILMGSAKLNRNNKYFAEDEDPKDLAASARSHLHLIAPALPGRIAAKAVADYRSGGSGKITTELLDAEIISAEELCREEAPRAELMVPEKEVLPDFDEEVLKAALDFKYPFETLSKIPKKASVSKLRPIIDSSKDPVVMKDPAKLFERVTTSGAFAGTAAHQFMQFCDYALAEKDCESEAARLLDEGFISEDQFDALDINELEAFFGSPLYSRIQKSPKVFREMRFNVFLPAKQLLMKETEGDVLLQGVIDCFFENPDGTFTIVDYKTDRVRSESILKERHFEQLRIYKLALEKMTSKKVKDILLYSFSLSRQVEL
ncbi:MAG: UvrD-helicase domain-containing protein [Clostridia bacterium]|nr:UvrD-helicase domain-containing protein [Clostridia bacterium]